MTRLRGAALAALVLVAGCAAEPPKPADAPPNALLEQPPPQPTPAPPVVAAPPSAPVPPRTAVELRTLPGWRTDRVTEVLPAFRAACIALSTARPAPPEAAALAPACAATSRLRLRPQDEAPLRAVLQRHFVAEAVPEEGLITGYYEPTLRVSAERTAAFSQPLLAGPASGVPDRAAVNAAAAAGEDLPAPVLAWADPVDAFFLEIQGSGRAMFPDGTVRRVGYAGQNGRTYVPVGRVLVERGIMRREEVSLQTIRAWMRSAGPEAARELMERNPAVVLFRWRDDLPPEGGPAGSLGTQLVPLRNVAVDRSRTALGLPMWVSTQHPITGRPLQRMVVAADTGGAIRGAARVDMFWGWEGGAEPAAGRMRETGQVWVLRPRRADEPEPPPERVAPVRRRGRR
ncbi:MltA domain-containing protein [Muricoccus radiodurans]|uniref:MltA domain-containing protein n=1 Tax=Muricoccus radiodurans TaxID=2231721 RepID=UPI003CEE0B7B